MKNLGSCATIAFLIFSSTLSAQPFEQQQSPLSENTYRCIIDIGSIATKLGCSDRLGHFKFEAEKPVGYRADLKKQQKNGGKCFSSEIKEQGVAAVSYLVGKAAMAARSTFDDVKNFQDRCVATQNGTFNVTSIDKTLKFHAIATASLRSDPSCGNEIASKITAETGVPLTIIDQYREGELAFQGIVAQLKRSPDTTISWDLGGGSTQILTIDRDGHPVRYLVEEGMFFFRDVLMKAFGKKEENYKNELSLEELRQAFAIAHRHIAARLEIDKNLQKIRERVQNPQTLIVATDGVEFIIAALMQNPHKKRVTRGEIESALERCVNMSDRELQQKLNVFVCPAFLAGAALIVGYMQVLDIEAVTLFNEGALRAGALIEDSFF